MAPVFPVVADLFPISASASTQGIEPSRVKAVKRQNGIFATPAGSEMKVRMIGRQREKSTVAVP